MKWNGLNLLGKEKEKVKKTYFSRKDWGVFFTSRQRGRKLEYVGEKEFTFSFVKLESQQDHRVNISEMRRGKG